MAILTLWLTLYICGAKGQDSHKGHPLCLLPIFLHETAKQQELLWCHGNRPRKEYCNYYKIIRQMFGSYSYFSYLCNRKKN